MSKLRRLARWSGLGLALLAVQPALAQPPPNLPPLYQTPLPTRSSPGALALPGGVVELPDITYQTVVGYRPLKLDLYLPPAGGGSRPLVLWIHGGGYEIGNPRADWTYGDWTQVLGALAARGYVVAGITYRLKREAAFPAQLEDARDALGFLRRNAGLWNIRSDDVVAWGLSAGANLAALLATGCTPASASAADACVQGVVAWFGPMDFRSQGDPGMAASLLHCPDQGCSPAQVAAISPALQVRPSTPPMVLMQGGADPMVHPDQAQAMAQALAAAGVPHKLIVYPGLGHGFSGASQAQLDDILRSSFDYVDALAGKRLDALK